jgi:6-pyruvoyltetrahydropterin/6-carboxytetrahydropterin synthase
VYRISKDFTFSAAHHLTGLPEDHPCSRHHGHNYTIRLVLEADNLNKVGFVKDYRELDAFKKYLDHLFDHQDLNEVVGHLNPTAENLAHYIYTFAFAWFPQLATVGVSETSKTWAFFYPGFIRQDEEGEELPEPVGEQSE